jgi:hypothetical protein
MNKLLRNFTIKSQSSIHQIGCQLASAHPSNGRFVNNGAEICGTFEDGHSAKGGGKMIF